jgi:hypothetical protein
MTQIFANQFLNNHCQYCINKYHVLLRSYMLEEEIKQLNANDLRALIERAKLCNIVYDCLGGSEECLKCGKQAFELDGEVLVNFSQPFLSNNRIDVLKSSASSEKDYRDARITCAHCGFVFQIRTIETKPMSEGMQ